MSMSVAGILATHFDNDYSKNYKWFELVIEMDLEDPTDNYD